MTNFLSSRWAIAAAVVVAAASVSAYFALAGRSETIPEIASDVAFDDAELIHAPLLVSEVKRGSGRAESNFILRNRTEREEVIRYKGADCGCTGVFLDDNSSPLQFDEAFVVDPGATRTIRIQSNLQSGPFQSAYSAHFEQIGLDEKPRTISCKMRVSVIADLTVEPDLLVHEFANDKASEPLEQSVTVTCAGRDASIIGRPPELRYLPREVRVLDVVPASIDNGEQDGLHFSRWNVRVRIASDADTRGDGSAQVVRVVLPGNDPEVSSAGLRIVIRRTTGIEAPRSIHFGIVEPGVSSQKRIVLRARDGKPFQVTKVISPSDVSGRSVQSGSQLFCCVDVAFKPSKLGNYRDAITILTDHPDCPRIAVEMSGECERELSAIAP